MINAQIVSAKKAFTLPNKLQTSAPVEGIISKQLDEGAVLPEYDAYVNGQPTCNADTWAGINLDPSADVVVPWNEPIARKVDIIQKVQNPYHRWW